MSSGKWKLLRNALLKSVNETPNENDVKEEDTIHRHEGFQLCQRNCLDNNIINEENGAEGILFYHIQQQFKARDDFIAFLNTLLNTNIIVNDEYRIIELTSIGIPNINEVFKIVNELNNLKDDEEDSIIININQELIQETMNKSKNKVYSKPIFMIRIKLNRSLIISYTNYIDKLNLFYRSKKNITTDNNDNNKGNILPYNECEYCKYNINDMSKDIDNENNYHDIYTRERKKNDRKSLNEVFSHKLYGVDNTGNIRVWNCEQILLSYLLSLNKDVINNKIILEIGGGMVGLAGLGIYFNRSPKKIILTDGHPDCVKNQELCIKLNTLLYYNISLNHLKNNCNIYSQRLRWNEREHETDEIIKDIPNLYYNFYNKKYAGIKKRKWIKKREELSNNNDEEKTEDNNNKINEEIKEEELMDIIIGSDCLFFEDFHDDLIELLYKLLKKESNSMIYLCQPSRGGSMERFLKKIIKLNYFNIFEITATNQDCISLNINNEETQFEIEMINSIEWEEIYNLHQTYLNDPNYEPDLHFPHLFKLTPKI